MIFLRFPLGISVSSILQFLGNFLHSIPDEDGSSSPIRYTSVFSHVEPDLRIDLLPIIVVTQLMRLLNFFALSSGSPCCTQSSINFSGLNFNQAELVDLFVHDVLGDLVHQNRILFESDESNSLYCAVDFFDIDSPTLITEPSPSSLLSVCTRFPEAGFLFFLKSNVTTRNVRNRGEFTHSGNTNGRHVIIHKCFCRVAWAHNLWCGACWPCSQNHPHSRRSALDPRFWVGFSTTKKVRTSKLGKWSRSDSQGTARMAGETSERKKARWRVTTCTVQQTLHSQTA